eukprot:CAMPEP_0201513600 /NCGR_PEP_ID=MMETSP0161_2-20130828/5638_1 /ASSEMBLY_ACC=CAM_ASM_000251 /TAXON_ID=180227 /ORGANISM="Neoparamoeba aestuarina, Strain SoJaBio B1-5/56/2" /LENGTH=85 /DNA_ID=CAMNT_0047909895 /DNA_START=117 /DNA_END=374 /DNA_ORIENTATION=+
MGKRRRNARDGEKGGKEKKMVQGEEEKGIKRQKDEGKWRRIEKEKKESPFLRFHLPNKKQAGKVNGDEENHVLYLSQKIEEDSAK